MFGLTVRLGVWSKVVVLVGVFGTFIATGCVYFGGRGVGKFEQPSRSVAESKMRGLFIRRIAVSQLDRNKNPQPQDIWIERVYELRRMFPIRKKQIGVRMCSRFSYQDSFDRRIGVGYLISDNTFGKGSSISSKGIVVFVVQVDQESDFTSNTVLSIQSQDSDTPPVTLELEL